ncbi:putative orphan protein; putative secreted protein [Pseudoalteromonas luteoviolacea B = ATCC 29581]|nr:putative orphan protein; putative secreted protein [Pseudoalteromonas luteoviolacea B = ATCC 29581]
MLGVGMAVQLVSASLSRLTIFKNENTMKKVYMFVSMLVLSLSQFAYANQSLAPELKVFEAYLGTWQSDFPISEGQTPVQDVTIWERALNGTTVRTLHSINNGMYGGESLIFWDKAKQQLVFYYFTTAGFYTQGYMEMLNDKEFVAYEAVTGNQDGITQVRSTSTLDGDSITVKTQYLKNGEWTMPEQRVYTRSDKQVIFQ